MTWYEIALTAAGAILGSNGLWALIAKLTEKRSATNRLLMGLAYSEIISAAERYIARGYISTDEYHELYHYLYEPYQSKGGNGTAARLMGVVKTLPPLPPSKNEQEGNKR